MSANFDIEQLDYFISEIAKINEPFMEKRIKKFLQEEGNKLKKQTLKVARAKVQADSGEYHKGIKRGKVYLYKGDTWAVRTYNSKPHAHLIEDGHRIVTKDGREVGFQKGKKVFKTSEKQFENKYLKDVDNLVDKILEEGLGF